MASILSFTPRAAATRPKPAGGVSASGSIVIFPGVRYERPRSWPPAGPLPGQGRAEGLAAQPRKDDRTRDPVWR